MISEGARSVRLGLEGSQIYMFNYFIITKLLKNSRAIK